MENVVYFETFTDLHDAIYYLEMTCHDYEKTEFDLIEAKLFFDNNRWKVSLMFGEAQFELPIEEIDDGA